MEEILKADPGQLQAEDSLYGGTPLHWAKTAEVKNITSCVLWLEIHNKLLGFEQLLQNLNQHKSMAQLPASDSGL